MNKAQKHFKTGMVKLDDLMGVRTRAIERSLKTIDFNNKKSDESSIENKNKDN